MCPPKPPPPHPPPHPNPPTPPNHIVRYAYVLDVHCLNEGNILKEGKADIHIGLLFINKKLKHVLVIGIFSYFKSANLSLLSHFDPFHPFLHGHSYVDKGFSTSEWLALGTNFSLQYLAPSELHLGGSHVLPQNMKDINFVSVNTCTV